MASEPLNLYIAVLKTDDLVLCRVDGVQAGGAALVGGQ